MVNSKRAGTHVDSDTLPSKPTGSTDAVNVVFTISAHARSSKARIFDTITRKTHDGRS